MFTVVTVGAEANSVDPLNGMSDSQRGTNAIFKKMIMA